jgi:ABC-2 type transport system permease protein
MAVYRRTYQAYEGALTPAGSRWLVLPRYAFRELLASRMLVVFLAACLVPTLVEAVIIYLVHNPTARALLHMGQSDLLSIDARFFYRIVSMQGGLALLLAAWIGPTVVVPDLTNGALALYLSRPLSRSAYLWGKLSALLVVLSAITWVPGLLLFALQAGLAGEGWGFAHVRLAVATVLASALWISLLAFLSVTLSAWLRWRIAATGLFFALFFVGAGMGEAWNAVLHTRWGRIINVNYLIDLIWHHLFGLTLRDPLPIAAAWAALLGLCLACLWLLDRRLRACEVVR